MTSSIPVTNFASLMHRVIAVATGGLDALPHNGAVITLLAICGLTHRKAY
jgi:H+/gluconate symporter-like permease